MQILKPGFDLDLFFKDLSTSAEALLFLDYDGTLAPFHIDPKQASPYPEVLPLINRLMKEAKTRVIIVSGRTIEDLLPFIPLDSLPELWGSHGGEHLTPANQYSKESLTPNQEQGLKMGWNRLIDHYTLERCEKKTTSIAAHWRGEDPDEIEIVKRIVIQAWAPLVKEYDLELHDFDGGIELRPKGLNKGKAIEAVLQNLNPESKTSVAYLGDDATDEEAFKALGDRGLKVLVRRDTRPTLADILIEPPEELLEFLKRWIDSRTGTKEKEKEPKKESHANNNNSYMTPGARFMVVSNRLPIELEVKEDKISVHSGSGGLVTALAPVLKNRGGMWIGWPGNIPDEEERKYRSVIVEGGKDSGFIFEPVFLTKQESELYYQGFSNEVLWPLFHDLLGRCNFKPEYWQGYQRANAKFADVVLKNIRPTDFLWIHDYHLLLLGDELRKKGVTSKIAFFLHIPFPSLDIFLKLPWGLQLLSALLQYDLIGFQTHRDHRNFIQCVRTLNPDVQISSKGHLHICKKEQKEILVGSFPISIDYKEFSTAAASKEVTDASWILHEKWPNQKLILSIDRLDYTKGIPERLEAIRTFLKNYPEFHTKVCFIQVIIPSRIAVPEYQGLKNEIDRLVGEINSQFTKENWVPVNHVFRSLNRTELLAHYRTAEVALVTPIKDGMNLVAKEYLACDIEQDGVLILSEFAGAASQLYSRALLVNPFDIEGIAKTLHAALTMPKEERQKRMKAMRQIVRRYDLYWWMKNYLRAAAGLELHDFPIVEDYALRQNQP